MRRLPLTLILFLTATGLPLAACSSNCIPGATIFCACPNGTQSNQICEAGGGYSACACGGTSGGSTGAATSAAAATSTSGTGPGTSSGGNGTSGSTTGPATGTSSGGIGSSTANSSGSSTGGTGSALTCSAPLDTPGTCTWPEFCVSGHCLPPQNLNSQGQDTPALACDTSSATPQGAGNLDDDRENGSFDLPLLGSPIITDLQQLQIAQNDDCAAFIGPGATEYQESARACAGGTVDDAGVAICATGEAAMLFEGGAFDPSSALPSSEGGELDAHFYWMTSTAAPVRFTDSAFGAAQSGFIIPATGWGAAGGRFVMVQCLGATQYPLVPNSDPVTLHFASSGPIDAGVPGNSFCTQWFP